MNYILENEMGLVEMITDYKKQEESLITEHYDRNRSIWTIPGTMVSCECSTEVLLKDSSDYCFPIELSGEQVEEQMRINHISDRNSCENKVTKNIRLPANEDETLRYQAKLREIRWNRQMLEEELIVSSDHTNAGPALKELVLKFMPLVSRRKHPEFWVVLNKTLSDGSEFIFHEPKVSVVCNCSDENIKEEISSMIANDDIWSLSETQQIIFIRNEHNKSLEGYSNMLDVPVEKGICKNPMHVKETVLKHRIGNLGCKACLTKMPDKITDRVSAAKWTANNVKIGTEVGTVRDIEYCPRFLSILRKLPIREYFKATKVNVEEMLSLHAPNKLCYAGLLHSAMSIVTQEVLIQDDKGPEELMYTIEKTFLVIEKRCDSCGYGEIKKEELVGYQQTINSEEEFGVKANEEITVESAESKSQ